MPINHNINVYLIDKEGAFTRVTQRYNGDDSFNATVVLNTGWQDGLLPEVNDRFPFFEVKFSYPHNTSLRADKITSSGWIFDIIVKNVQQDIINNRVNKPDSYCTISITDPFGIQENYVINPTIENIAGYYKLFCDLLLTESFSKAKYQIQITQIEDQLKLLNEQVIHLKEKLSAL